MFTYVIKGEGMMALPVKSDLNWNEFKFLIKSRTRKLHPKAHDLVFKWGIIEFINPQVMTLKDFGSYCPALM